MAKAVNVLLLICCCAFSFQLETAALPDPYFIALRDNVKDPLGVLYQSKHADTGIYKWGLTNLAEFLQIHLTKTYKKCTWAVVLYKRTDSNLLPPGYNGGAMDNTECDIDVPPDSCIQTGGSVIVTQSLQRGTSPPEEHYIVVFLRPKGEKLHKYRVPNESGTEVWHPYIVALYQVTIKCAKTARDWTDLARHILTGMQEEGHVPMRGGVVISEKGDKLGLAGRDGGLIIPAFHIPIELSTGVELKVFVVGLPPAPKR